MRLPGEAEALACAKARLDRMELYPRPVEVSRVSIRVVPWLFRLPGFRRFRGYAFARWILLKRPLLDEDLIVHELCHLWQEQHEPLRMWLSYARPSTFSRDRSAYRANRYEREARDAVAATRAVSAARPAGSGDPMTSKFAPVLEVPGPVEPDQPTPNPPGSPETPDPGSPDVPSFDPKGPEIPDSPPSPEPQQPAEPV